MEDTGAAADGMASLSRSTASTRAKARGSFSIHEDDAPSSPASYRGVSFSPPKTSPHRNHRQGTALHSSAVDHSQNWVFSPSCSSPTAGPASQAHTNGPKRERRGSILKSGESRAPLARIPLDSNTFVAPQKHAHFDLPQEQSDVDEPEQKCGISDDPPECYSQSVKEQLALNREGQFDLILSIPAGAPDGDSFDSRFSQETLEPVEEQKSYYGCNIVHQHTNQLPEDPESCFIGGSTSTTYQLIATPIPIDYLMEESILEDANIMEESKDALVTTPIKPERLPVLQSDSGYAEENRPSPLQRHGSSYSSPAGPRSPGGAFAGVEDTFEELDGLEEQFEAVDSFMSVDPIFSPDRVPARSTSTYRPVNSSPGDAQLKRTSSVTSKSSLSRTGSLRVGAAEGLSCPRPLRKSTSMTLPTSHDSPSPNLAPMPARKSSIQRPMSLHPPKPPAKSAKPPTIPSFRLPGEAVAQRLREQRETRMAQLLTAEPPPPPPVRKASRRGPTIPSFELPGEAISRRKREEHEARLRAQEEEERKRREFKARPIRASLAPSAGCLPRETVASRARAAAAANSEVDIKRKRQSVAPGAGLARSGSMLSRGSSQSRGRERSSQDVAASSRAASSSTGSMSGKRSVAASVTVEDVQLQKMRGKAVWDRDNRSVGKDQEREKRERVGAAQNARKEAAERSGMLSREWAEKQKMRLKGMVGQGGKGVVA